MAVHSSVLAWGLPWIEKPGLCDSLQGHKESNMIEQLALSLHFLGNSGNNKSEDPDALVYRSLREGFICLF